MKVAVVGCGALGSFYGAKLCWLGSETHFLLRSDYEAVRRKGVFIRSRDGNFHVNPKCAKSPEQIGISDLVLIGLKTTANDQFSVLLPPLVGPHTAILTLQNGLGNEEALAKLFPAEQIMGGLAFVCLNRTAPGQIHHIDHGKIVIGEFQRWPEPRTHEIADRFRKSGVPCDVTDTLAQAHWEKLVWNIPFNGLSVASCVGYENLMRGEATEIRAACLTTDKLLAEPRWSQLVRDVMAEVVAAARGLGFSLGPEVIEQQINRTKTMGAYKPSTALDFERGFPLELDAMFREPLGQARQADVAAPRLSALVRVLEQVAP
jgi:2-dehydropantoate 2-reductase